MTRKVIFALLNGATDAGSRVYPNRAPASAEPPLELQERPPDRRDGGGLPLKQWLTQRAVTIQLHASRTARRSGVRYAYALCCSVDLRDQMVVAKGKPIGMPWIAQRAHVLTCRQDLAIAVLASTEFITSGAEAATCKLPVVMLRI